MNKSKRIFTRLAVLISIVLVVMIALSYAVLWRSVIEQKREDLLLIAQLQAAVLESAVEKAADVEGSAVSRDLSWLQAINRMPDYIESTEILILSRPQSKQQPFLLHDIQGKKPMQRVAGSAEISNSIYQPWPTLVENRQGLDLNGETVLAALVPVNSGALAVIAKIDMAELSMPFIKLGIVGLVIIVLLLILLLGLFQRIVQPVAMEIIENEQRFRDLVENINEWTWEINPFGRIIYCSPRVSEILGYHHEELIGLSLYDLMMGLEAQKLKSALLSSRNNPASVRAMEYSFINKEQEVVTLEISAESVMDSRHRLCGYRGFALDISERKSKERQLYKYQNKLEMMVTDRTLELERVNKELRDFSYIVSHDLRSPLVSISGFAGELESDLKLIDKAVGATLFEEDKEQYHEARFALYETIPESLHFIDASIEKMNRLINSILALSRIGERALNYEAVDVKKLLVDSVEAMAFQIEQLNVSVNIADLPVIKTDAVALEQIFSNLLDNAVKYLDPARQGIIKISCEQQSGQIVFHIQDNGVGVAEKDLVEVFKLFKRVGEQKVAGEGMGLTYVQTLVRRLGGKIECHSEQGFGSVFSFSVPL